MCAKADYREGWRVLSAELRKLLRGTRVRWGLISARRQAKRETGKRTNTGKLIEEL